MSDPGPSDAVGDVSDVSSESDVDDPTDIAALESRVEELTERVDEDVEDLRERLVRVYRDVEGKAEEDHTHPETTDRIDAVAADVDEMDEVTARLETDLDALADRTESVAGDVAAAAESAADAEDRVEDLAARVESLADANDDAMDKLSRVASAVVRTQRRLRALEREQSERDRLDDLLAEANRHGIRTAECDGCGNGVRLSLLSKPECPYCEGRIDAIDPGRRFIGTTWLRVDNTPALEGAVAATEDGGEATGGAPDERAASGEATRGSASGEPTDGRADDREDPAGPDVSTRDAGSDDSSDTGVGDAR
ncbi:putative nuclease with TOPRIM domain [Halorubrum alkaliphilum]|uniref:Putative nuclease with TOPRIM domain n=1 Tax=Halorubrum alkaliphilum TaxID=261290 RepID=A0A8T4GD43_9EURY|nr:hypothetical protein [Halorubrum alkaliphilum]MBP1921182.1 putative nuclease with TOPRIM domain [Halorubrum alkaliphilum]